MNINAIQEKLDNLQQKPKKGGNNDRKKFVWKPQFGKSTVRIVPLKGNPDNPFQELFFHYGFGKRTIISPIVFGDKDPILEFSKELRKSKEPEDWKLAKKLEPKMRTFVLVLVRGEEEKGVRLWDFGKTVYQSLLSMATDEEIGDYTDPLEGRDIKVEYTKGTPYAETSVMVSLKTGPISDDSEVMEAALNEQPDPKELYNKYSFEEIKGFLEEWLEGSDEEEGGEGETNGLTDKQVNNMFKKEEEKDTSSIMDGPATDFESSTPPVVTNSKKKSVINNTVSDKEFDELFKESK